MRISTTIAILASCAITLPAPAAKLTADAVEAGTTATVGPRSRGPHVLRAQVLLERARFSPGEIDAAYGSNVRRAVNGFQASRGLAVTGVVGPATWAALDADAAPVLATHVVTAEDVKGPFVPIPADMMEKSKMDRLGYSSALEALAEKFHASPALLEQLNPGKDVTSVGTEILVPSVEPTSLVTPASLVVDASDSTIALLDGDGKVLAQYPATTGSEKDPLPVGDWKIAGIARDPVFHYQPSLFWDANPAHAEATIPAGPNNPVGVAWIDLSKEHYGIHGTPEPSKIAKTQSHGCIRTTNWAAAELARVLTVGMPAVLRP